MNRTAEYLPAIKHAFRMAARCSQDRLFSPFYLQKWLLFGLAAWLTVLYKMKNHLVHLVELMAGLARGGIEISSRNVFITDPSRLWFEFSSWLAEHILLMFVTGAVVLLLFVLMFWISAIFELVFLDKISRRSFSMMLDWRRFVNRGWSLFVLRLIAIVLMILSAVSAFASIVLIAFLFARNQSDSLVPAIAVLLTVALFVIGVMALVSFVRVIVYDFVIPFIYKFDIGALAAVDYTTKLFKVHWQGVLLYWMIRETVVLGVKILLGLIVLFSLFLILVPYAIPVLGMAWDFVITLALLPIYIFFRALGPCFLERLNPKYGMIDI